MSVSADFGGTDRDEDSVGWRGCSDQKLSTIHRRIVTTDLPSRSADHTLLSFGNAGHASGTWPVSRFSGGLGVEDDRLNEILRVDFPIHAY